MFGKKKPKTVEENKAICPFCSLDCRDQSSLQRHLDWAHKEEKSTVKA